MYFLCLSFFILSCHFFFLSVCVFCVVFVFFSFFSRRPHSFLSPRDLPCWFMGPKCISVIPSTPAPLTGVIFFQQNPRVSTSPDENVVSSNCSPARLYEPPPPSRESLRVSPPICHLTEYMLGFTMNPSADLNFDRSQSLRRGPPRGRHLSWEIRGVGERKFGI